MIRNSLVQLRKSRRFPIMIANNTNQTVTLQRGCLLGYAHPISDETISETNVEHFLPWDKVQTHVQLNAVSKSELETDVQVPDKFREQI